MRLVPVWWVVVASSTLAFHLEATGYAQPKMPSGGKQSVIAEGAGVTPEAALQDAFRNAIRKVVGALVDEDTVVQNDRLISEKVLVYSDGIIKGGYKELSRQEEKGLWRIKIEARVERRSVAARLRDAQIKVREVKGEDIAIEVLTRKEARERATDLMVAVLPDLPKVMVAGVRKPGANDYDDRPEKLRLDVTIRADLKKYRTFLKRLLLVLDKISLRKESFSIQAALPNQRIPSARGIQRTLPRPGLDISAIGADEGVAWVATNVSGMLGPRLDQFPNSWCMWVLTRMEVQSGLSEWTCYVLDCDMQKTLECLQGELAGVVVLIDANGKELARVEIPLHQSQSELRSTDRPLLGRALTGRSHVSNLWLAQGIPRTRALSAKRSLAPRALLGPSLTTSSRVGSLLDGLESNDRQTWEVDSETAVNAFIAPIAFSVANLNSQLSYIPWATYHRVIGISVADLGRLKEVKASVEFRPVGRSGKEDLQKERASNP